MYKKFFHLTILASIFTMVLSYGFDALSDKHKKWCKKSWEDCNEWCDGNQAKEAGVLLCQQGCRHGRKACDKKEDPSNVMDYCMRACTESQIVYPICREGCVEMFKIFQPKLEPAPMSPEPK